MIFLLTSCLIRPTILEPAPQALQQQLDTVDWSAVEKEATDILVEYIQTDTTNPPGNELLGAQYLASVLETEGIESKIILSAETLSLYRTPNY